MFESCHPDHYSKSRIKRLANPAFFVGAGDRIEDRYSAHYRPSDDFAYPRRPFTSLLVAGAWVGEFLRWYNTEHRHSSFGFVTPEQCHYGRIRDLLERCHALYQAAREWH